jgi:hypothetical protein
MLFPLVPITTTLGTLFKVCIISTEQYTIVLACMDFFQPLFPEDRLSSSPHKTDSAIWFPSSSMSLSTSNRCVKLLLLQP